MPCRLPSYCRLSRCRQIPAFLVAGIGDPGRHHRCRLQLRCDKRERNGPGGKSGRPKSNLVSYRGDGVGEGSPFFPLPLPWPPPCCPPCCLCPMFLFLRVSSDSTSETPRAMPTSCSRLRLPPFFAFPRSIESREDVPPDAPGSYSPLWPLCLRLPCTKDSTGEDPA